MKIFKIIPIFLFVSLFFFSCKTTRRIHPAQAKKISAVYDSLSAHYLDYNTLYIKSSLKYKNKKKSLKLKATIKILKDSMIIASLSPGLGIEAARIKFTTDSIFIMDRLSSHLSKTSYRYLLDSLNISVDYFDIQHILTNQLFIYPKDKVQTVKSQLVHNYSIEEQEGNIRLYRKTLSNIEQFILISSSDYQILETKLNELDNNRFMDIKFIDQYSEVYKSVPKTINIVSFSNNQSLFIDLNYLKVQKDKQLRFSFRVPSKYDITIL